MYVLQKHLCHFLKGRTDCGYISLVCWVYTNSLLLAFIDVRGFWIKEEHILKDSSSAEKVLQLIAQLD